MDSDEHKQHESLAVKKSMFQNTTPCTHPFIKMRKELALISFAPSLVYSSAFPCLSLHYSASTSVIILLNLEHITMTSIPSDSSGKVCGDDYPKFTFIYFTNPP